MFARLYQRIASKQESVCQQIISVRHNPLGQSNVQVIHNTLMENLPVKRTRLVKWLAIWGVWTLFGLFFTTQLALQSQLWKTPVPFWRILSWQLVSGYIWFALSPLILFLTNRFPFEAGRWKISLFQSTPAGWHQHPEAREALTQELRGLLAPQ